ncbi:reverse transcriptase domain-containing protein [Tanacetum coccineum]|uniref:Reverse transcriptase domain-containing protein n=1 Tax=Tanacetum coccineum TaxID=301880 RepID=A0ABQ4XT74_9ASTR
MDDNRTMAQLLEAPTEGYEDAIVVPEITANNFEIKHGLLNLVQNKQFFGHDKEDPHAHIRYFNKITSTDESSRTSRRILPSPALRTLPIVACLFGLCNAPGNGSKVYGQFNLSRMIEKNTWKSYMDISQFYVTRSLLAFPPRQNAPKGILGQIKTNHFQPITLMQAKLYEAQAHYTTTKRIYFCRSVDDKPKISPWRIFAASQEFDVVIRDKKEQKILRADHLSRLEQSHQVRLRRTNRNLTENIYPLETLGNGYLSW